MMKYRWVSLGIGSSMAKADVYVAWPNGPDMVISRRTSAAQAEPIYSEADQIAQIVAIKRPPPSWAKIAFSFSRPIKADPEILPTSPYIYASADSAPATPANPGSTFSKHTEDGSIPRFNFFSTDTRSTATGTTVTNSTTKVVFNSACVPGNKFCLYGVPKGKDIVFTVHAAAKGWAGFALGDRMSSGDFYIGWKNSTNGYSLSRRTANGKGMPTFSNSQQITALPLQRQAPAWATIAFSFQRPASITGSAISANSKFIYGTSDDAVSEIDNPRSSFGIHKGGGYGSLPTVNFLSTNGSSALGGGATKAFISSTPSQYKQVMIAHGILFYMAWAISPFIGIFIARYLKQTLGVWWYRLHLGFMFVGTGLLTLISFIVIVLYKKPNHFDDTHTILGLVISVATGLQVLLGFLANALWDAKRTAIPWWDKAHWWLGRSVFILALVNIYLGIDSFSKVTGMSIASFNTMVALYVFSVFLGVASMLYGQFKFGQTYDMAEENFKHRKHGF